MQDRAEYLRGQLDAMREHVAKVESENVRLRATLGEMHERVTAFEKAEQTILHLPHKYPLMSDKTTTHEGPPLYTSAQALSLYRASVEKRKSALTRTVMTDEQRAAFVGDSKPT